MFTTISWQRKRPEQERARSETRRTVDERASRDQKQVEQATRSRGKKSRLKENQSASKLISKQAEDSRPQESALSTDLRICTTFRESAEQETMLAGHERDERQQESLASRLMSTSWSRVRPRPGPATRRQRRASASLLSSLAMPRNHYTYSTVILISIVLFTMPQFIILLSSCDQSQSPSQSQLSSSSSQNQLVDSISRPVAGAAAAASASPSSQHQQQSSLGKSESSSSSQPKHSNHDQDPQESNPIMSALIAEPQQQQHHQAAGMASSADAPISAPASSPLNAPAASTSSSAHLLAVPAHQAASATSNSIQLAHNNNQHHHQAAAMASANLQLEQTNNNNINSNEPNNNVILIKYANVTSSKQVDNKNADDDFTESIDSIQSQNLQVFRLADEPLSVSVIQSKFSASIRIFDVSFNRLKSLPNDLFCPLSNEVRILNTSHNLLENFDCLGLISQAGQLCLSDLRQLDMSHNLIRHLPATSVATLHNLQTLDLSHNLIDALDELSLSSLIKLSKLSLAHNRLVQLPARLFHKSSSMRVLKLSFNRLEITVTNQLLSGLKSLEEIDLSHNNLSQVSEFAFVDKLNLTRVDLSFNQIRTLQQAVLSVSQNPLISNRHALNSNNNYNQQQHRQRLTHNGQLVAPTQSHHNNDHENANFNHLAPVLHSHQSHHNSQHGSPLVQAQFYLAQNPFLCDCQLEWLRRLHEVQQQQQHLNQHQHQHQHHHTRTARSASAFSSQASSRRSLSSAASPASQIFPPNNNQFNSNNDQNNNYFAQLFSNQNYQNDQAPSVILAPAGSADQETSNSSSLNQQQFSSSMGGDYLQSINGQSQHRLARVADFDLIKCQASFKKQQPFMHPSRQRQQYSSKTLSSLAPSSSEYWQQLTHVEPANFLCRYKSHCFALCQCCEFDACDCEMICPPACNCYYDSTWQTNVIDCSNSNHTSVPDRIPMDVSGLFLDGNQIDSLRPSNLIARKSLKHLYLNSTQLQFIANRSFNGLIELEMLYLNDNQLTRLNGYEFEPLGQLRALYLQSNRLDFIDPASFIYLRSLEILDLSNNRLTTLPNLDLLSKIGYHNIRMRHLSIAHNWWSCQCELIRKFRDILEKKFLSNGNQVNIVDRSQLRCYYNATTIGPLILENQLTHHNQRHQQASVPLFSSLFNNNKNQHQLQLTEVNGCSDFPIGDDGHQLIGADPTLISSNPPQISNWFTWPPASNDQVPRPNYNTQPNQINSRQQQQPELDPFDPSQANQPSFIPNNFPSSDQPIDTSASSSIYPPASMGPTPTLIAGGGATSSTLSSSSGASFMLIPFGGSLLFLMLGLCSLLLIGAGVFVFVRHQQQRQQNGHHHHHLGRPHHFRQQRRSGGAKSSTGSTLSSHSSDGGSSTGIESLGAGANAKGHQQHRSTLQHQTTISGTTFGIMHPQQQHQFVPGQQHHQLIIEQQSGRPAAASLHHTNHSQGGSSSQSNIYAALVSPPSSIIGSSNAHSNNMASNFHHHAHSGGDNGGLPINQATSINNNANNLYTNNNTRSFYSSSNTNQQHQYASALDSQYNLHQQSSQLKLHNNNNMTSNVYKCASGSGSTSQSLYGGAKSIGGACGGLDSPVVLADDQWAGPNGAATAGGNGQPTFDSAKNNVKNFVSKFFSKSFAKSAFNQVAGSAGARYRGAGACSRDELSALASDKIYDAFISYDKRDEPFVMQHISAELEYGQPQYRIADRFRDLPLPNSAYMAEAITSVIGCSHRTIIVLTRAYLTNEWCRFELRSAINELAADRSHKIIAILPEPACLLELDAEMRQLLASIGLLDSAAASLASSASSQQLVQLDQSAAGSPHAIASQVDFLASPDQAGPASSAGQAAGQLVATLTSAGRVVVSNSSAANSNGSGSQSTTKHQQRASMISYQDRKFWLRLKQLMPAARPPTQTFTLTTKN